MRNSHASFTWGNPCRIKPSNKVRLLCSLCSMEVYVEIQRIVTYGLYNYYKVFPPLLFSLTFLY